MTLETFFEKFELFAGAPNAVARMRELVLNLAVQGRLINQDPNHESASMLLKRITADPNRPKNRTTKSNAANGVNEPPYRLPLNWAWTNLGTIAHWGSGSTPTRGYQQYYGGDITWLKSGELNDNQSLAGSEERITALAIEKGSFRRNKPGDVLFAMYGATVGKVAILAEAAVTNQAVCGCTPVDGISNRYLFYYLISRREEFRAASEGGAQPNFSKDKIIIFPFPLPPLAEQKRIVAKVDELMALCDRLEAQQQERQSKHATLSRASLARFADAPTPANLNYIFHPAYAIDPAELRKTILTLAVQGKLVRQNTRDEPAKKLAERIEAERRAIGGRTYTAVLPREQSTAIPSAWTWVRLGNLALKSDSGWSPQCGAIPRSENNWGVLKVSAVTWGVFLPDENKALPKGLKGRPEFEVQSGDFLLTRANTEELIARSVIAENVPPKLMMSDKIVRFRFSDSLDHRYINLFNASTPARQYYAANATGTSSSMKNVGREVMCNLPVPLPPLAEQRRIVAKVDQLMALVDQLEGQLAAGRATAEKLLDAVVAELTNRS